MAIRRRRRRRPAGCRPGWLVNNGNGELREHRLTMARHLPERDRRLPAQPRFSRRAKHKLPGLRQFRLQLKDGWIGYIHPFEQLHGRFCVAGNVISQLDLGHRMQKEIRIVRDRLCGFVFKARVHQRNTLSTGRVKERLQRQRFTTRHEINARGLLLCRQRDGRRHGADQRGTRRSGKWCEQRLCSQAVGRLAQLRRQVAHQQLPLFQLFVQQESAMMMPAFSFSRNRRQTPAHHAPASHDLPPFFGHAEDGREESAQVQCLTKCDCTFPAPIYIYRIGIAVSIVWPRNFLPGPYLRSMRSFSVRGSQWPGGVIALSGLIEEPRLMTGKPRKSTTLLSAWPSSI